MESVSQAVRAVRNRRGRVSDRLQSSDLIGFRGSDQQLQDRNVQRRHKAEHPLHRGQFRALGVGPSRGRGGSIPPWPRGVRSRFNRYRTGPGSSRARSGGLTLHAQPPGSPRQVFAEQAPAFLLEVPRRIDVAVVFGPAGLAAPLAIRQRQGLSDRMAPAAALRAREPRIHLDVGPARPLRLVADLPAQATRSVSAAPDRGLRLRRNRRAFWGGVSRSGMAAVDTGNMVRRTNWGDVPGLPSSERSDLGESAALRVDRCLPGVGVQVNVGAFAGVRGRVKRILSRRRRRRWVRHRTRRGRSVRAGNARSRRDCGWPGRNRARV